MSGHTTMWHTLSALWAHLMTPTDCPTDMMIQNDTIRDTMQHNIALGTFRNT